MQLLSYVNFETVHRKYRVDFTKNPVQIIDSSRGIQVLHAIEMLLAHDLGNRYFALDNEKYSEIVGVSTLSFGDSSIVGEHYGAKQIGNVPKIHYIRYLGNGINSIRSALIDEHLGTSDIVQDLVQHPEFIPCNTRAYFSAVVNSIVGYDFIKAVNEEQVEFNFVDYIPADALKVVYLIIAECTLTPSGYNRVILLPDVPDLSSKIKLRLLTALGSTYGGASVITNMKLNSEDISDRSTISILSL